LQNAKLLKRFVFHIAFVFIGTWYFIQIIFIYLFIKIFVNIDVVFLNFIILNLALFTDPCTTFNRIGGVVVSVLASSAVDRGFDCIKYQVPINTKAL
jgi:hypothetical protein